MCETQKQGITETRNDCSHNPNTDQYRYLISYSLQSKNREHHEEILKNAINDTLKRIFSNNIISGYLGLKGGLVANFYGLKRESMDIDLDILDLSKYDIIINEIRKSLQEVGEIRDELLLEGGYRFIAYRKIGDTRAKIQIDLSKHVYESNNYDFQELDGIPIRQMTKDCMFANKLVSLSQRLKDSDLYDVNAFLQNDFPINTNIIKERTNMGMKQFIERLITILDPYNGYYQPTLTTKIPRICQKESDINRIWFENAALLQETIILLNNYKDRLNSK